MPLGEYAQVLIQYRKQKYITICIWEHPMHKALFYLVAITFYNSNDIDEAIYDKTECQASKQLVSFLMSGMTRP